MSLPRAARGYVLIASLFALSVFSVLGFVATQNSIQQTRIDAAHRAGTMGAQFKQALRALIAREGTGVTTGTFTGTNWLKDSGSCAGATGSARYLPCEFPNFLPLELAYSTVVTSAGGVVTATVSFGTPSVGGNSKPALAGEVVAAINGTAADYSTPATQTYYAANNNVTTGAISLMVTNAQENLEFVKVNGTSTITGDHDWNNFSISNLRNLGVNGTVTAGTVTATSINATSISAGTVTTSRTTDRDNNGYYSDLSGTSRLNYANINLVRLSNNYAAGGGCSTKQIGTTNTGEFLSCVNGVWTKAGGMTITSAGSNSNGLWRIWSDGYKEMWSTSTFTLSSQQTRTHSFPKHFSQTPIVTVMDVRRVDSLLNVSLRSTPTTSTFRATNSGGCCTKTYMWRASGY